MSDPWKSSILKRIVLGVWLAVGSLIIGLAAAFLGLLDNGFAFSEPVEAPADRPGIPSKRSSIKLRPAHASAIPSPPVESRGPDLAEAPARTPAAVEETPYFEGPIAIGHSVEGRSIEVFRFGTGPEKRMIVAGIHGGYEWNTTALAEALMDHLHLVPDTVPPHITLYILPALNPDGLARSQGYEGRANAHGVDLNRNWPFDWAPEWPRAGCWDFLPITAGTRPASEPETEALLTFLQIHSLSALISYHSAALGIFPGGLPARLPSVDLAQTLAAAGGYRYPPANTGCTITGNLVDWAAENGIPAVDLELLTHHDIDYEQNLRVLEAFLNWQPDLGSR